MKKISWKLVKTTEKQSQQIRIHTDIEGYENNKWLTCAFQKATLPISTVKADFVIPGLPELEMSKDREREREKEIHVLVKPRLM